MSVRRIASAIGAALVIVGLGAGPASAHSAGNTPASNYVSRVIGIKPPTDSFTAKTVEAGSRIEITWRTGPDVVVLDYEGFDYLRLGADGVFENSQSRAVYVNANRQGSAPIPEGLHPEGPPEWRRISSGHVARFHDHRVHYMGAEPPPQVRQARQRNHLVQDFSIEVRRAGVTHSVLGSVRWIPGPSPLPALGLGAAAGVLSAAAIVLASGRQLANAAFGGFCVLLGALVLVDALHLFGIAFGVRGGSGFARVLSIGWASVAAWAIAVACIVALRRRRLDALYVAVFAAGIMTLVGGFSDLGVLSASSVPFAFSNVVARAVIALTLGLGVAAIVSGVVLTGSASARSAFDKTDVPEEPAEPTTA